nr:putative ribonuclease H-like domain-containing protein [Tanacetum cinerariifolium]
VDSGCSRSMTGNKEKLDDFVQVKGACNKEKQHKASYKAISAVRTIFEPLKLLHMYLFGPTSIRSIDHKYYSLVVTDDFSRFSWAFFLGTKNAKLIDLCGEKEIKKDYSNPRTLQQNGVAERKNRTLIEAARSMLADSKLPTMFWTKAVSTACYVLNRVSITNPHNKTPYELLFGKGLGQEWYFDLDYLTDSLGYTRFKTNTPAAFQVPSVPASNVPAGGVLAGSIDSAGFGDPAASESVRAVLPPNHAANSTLPPGLSLGSSEHSTRFPSLSDLENHQPTTGIFSSSFHDDDFCADVTNLASSVAVDPVATKRVNTTHPQSQIIGELQSPVQTRSTVQKSKFGESAFINYVYVDDIIFGSTNKAWCDEFEVLMKGEFEMSAMCELTFFLELQVKQLSDGIFISQDKYVKDMLKKFDMEIVKTATTPYEVPKPKSKDDSDNAVNVTPMSSHLNAVKKIFKYLKGQPNLGLWYPRDSPFQLEAYSDSDYARSHGDRKSTNGGCQFLGRSLISWQCKKQTVVATSSTEAKYVVAASCCGQSTICIVKNPVFNQRTKHIEIRHHFIRDANEKNLIQVLKIHIDENVADLLTKAFNGPRFLYLVVHIGMLNP